MAAKVKGFVEQVALQLTGLKLAGWALRDGAAPDHFLLQWGDRIQPIEPTKVRSDVGRAEGVGDIACGFQTIIPVDLSRPLEWPDISVKAVWNKADARLPFLKPAEAGWAEARRRACEEAARIDSLRVESDPDRDSHTPWNAMLLKERFGSVKRRRDLLDFVRPHGVGIELGVAAGPFSRLLLMRGRLSFLYGVDLYGDDQHNVAEYRAALR